MIQKHIEFNKSLMPFPIIHEIAVEFRGEKRSKIKFGDDQEVWIIPDCEGFFHSHPHLSDNVFSLADIYLIMKNKMKYALLGYSDELYLIQIDESIQKMYDQSIKYGWKVTLTRKFNRKLVRIV